MFSKNKLTIFIILILLSSCLSAQIFGFEETRRKRTFFKYNITPYPHTSRDSVRLNIQFDIPYSSLQFLKENNNFVANFESNLYLYNSKDSLINSSIQKHEIKVENYKDIYSENRSKNININFYVPADKYTIHLGINDYETQNPHYQKKEINLKNFYEHPVTISYLNIIDTIGKEPQTNLDQYLPDKSTLDTTEKFFISFHVLAPDTNATISCEVYDNNQVVKSKNIEYQFHEGLNRILIPLDKTGMEYKKYDLKLSINLGEEKVEREKQFRLHWKDMTDFIENLDEAIKQLVYITTRRKVADIMKGDKEEKKRKFLNFWDKKDPTPATDKNELMIEYYRRVKVANQNFSDPRGGWRSDRGKVYIIFGPPDRVERNTLNPNTRPYVVWHYRNPPKTFYFVDMTGFGDYKLQNPNAVWNR